MNELCRKLMSTLVESEIKEVTKAEQDYSYSTINSESVEFKTTTGLLIRLSIVSPKAINKEETV